MLAFSIMFTGWAIDTTLPQQRRSIHPTRLIALGFLGAILVGTLLLLIPAATVSGSGATFLEALFTAVSAVCVTGLIVVDTATYWSPLGQSIILALIQVGGFGIMTFASLLGIMLSRRLGLSARISVAAETKNQGFGDVKAVLLGVLKATVLIEAATAALLTARFMAGYGKPFGEALWHGVFHSISAFNNAGFALYTDNLMSFVADPWIILPIAAAVILGGLGFPVLMQLRKEFRSPLHWSMNTKLVLAGSAVLLVAGTVFFLAVEWSNPATLGGLGLGAKLLAGFFQAVVPRTAGFNSLDYAAMDPVTWLGTDVLMFIGASPAGTGGGLKVTTFAVLFFIMYTEMRGEVAVNIFGKRLSRSVHRQAITLVLLAIAVVVLPTMALMLMTDFGLDRLLFEVISAFATVGLSTGITAQLPVAGQLLLIAVMYIGRIGPVTFATALALHQRRRLYELPKERPLIG